MILVTILTALLPALLPVLFLYAHNATQLHPEQLLTPLLIVAGLTAVSFAVLWAGLRHARVASVVAGILVFLLQSFGAVRDAVSSSGVPASWDAGLAAALLFVGILLLVRRGWRAARGAARGAARTASWSGVQRVVTSTALILVLWQVGRIVVVEARAPQQAASAVSTSGSVPSSTPVRIDASLPDIFFVLLDGYGSGRVLREQYGWDNADFVAALEGHGFQVLEGSRANYVGTLWALGSILNLDYLQELLDVDVDSRQLNPLIRLVRSNRVVHELRAQGYEIVTLASGYGVAEFGKPDLYLELPQGRSDFEQMLLDATPLALWSRGPVDAHEMHRRRLHWAFDALPQVQRGRRPQFVFAHILAPHPPFVVDAAGKAPDWPRTYALNDGTDYLKLGRTAAQYREGYAGQVQWVSQQTLQMLERLVRSRDTPPVIVLVSDHGPGAGLDWDHLENTDLDERYGILQAVALPGAAADVPVLPDDLSPVSLFRLLFDRYLGTNLGLLPPRSYYCTRLRPYDFVDITDRLSPHP